MVICTLICHFMLPGCRSLKEKRSQLKPLIMRLQREYNISVAEIDRQDILDEAVIACALISNQRSLAEQTFSGVIVFIETFWMNIQLIKHHIEWR